MKIQIPSNLIIAAFCCCASVAQEKPQPLVQIKIQSFDTLTANAKRVAAAIGASADWNPGSHLSEAVGSPDLAGVDRKRSWQLALAMRNLGAPPLIALYVPVSNFETFKSGLKESSPLKGGDKPNEMFQAGEFAVVVFRMGQAEAISADEKQKAKAWSPAPGAGAHLVEVAVQLDEMARQQAIQALGMGRMIVTQGVAQQKLPEGAPINPQAMAQMIGLYFDGIETVLKGLNRLEVQVDLTDQIFSIGKMIQPLPESELARWFKGVGGISDIANQLDPKATVSLAGAIGEKPPFMAFLKKLVRVSFQMQNQEVDEKTAGQIERLMDALTPMKFVGSVDFRPAMSYAGFYEFPGADANNTYASIKQIFTNMMPSLTGTNKAYSAFAFKEGFRKVGGNAVDRFSMTFNLDAPMFKMPGQREMIERMWGGGKMEIEYAAKGNRLYLASPDKMTDLLESAPRKPSATGLGATPNTVLLGRANLLALIKQMLSVNPMLPAEVREKFEKINIEGGDIRFRVDLDGRLSSRAELPLKILEAFRHFQTAEK